MTWDSALRNRLSILGLVASDMSYKIGTIDTAYNPDGSTARIGEPLAPYPDPDTTFAPNLISVTGVTLTDWITDFRYDDPATGFGVTVFKNAATKEFVVAVEGTDGLNGQDWYNNLNYGTLQWTDTNKSRLFDYLLDSSKVPPDAKVLFTGQSLGGALAQFAIYDYALRKSTAFDPSTVSLITY